MINHAGGRRTVGDTGVMSDVAPYQTPLPPVAVSLLIGTHISAQCLVGRSFGVGNMLVKLFVTVGIAPRA